MSISEYAGWLDSYTWPKVGCPTCKAGGLGLVQKSVTTLEDLPSKAASEAHLKGLAGPEELAGTFHGHLLCDNSACGESVTIAGDWQYVVNEGDHPEWGSYGDVFAVRYVNPPLQIMRVPEKTPQKVKERIAGASMILWASPAAAANALRQATEELLTARKVKRFVVNVKGKRQAIALDSRIAIFGKSHPEVAQTLLAVKWIGNNGSHDSSLTVQQVLVGAEILEAAIKAMYGNMEAELKAKVKAINKAKGFPKTKF